jgi:two-component system NtrC family sensor kinase
LTFALWNAILRREVRKRKKAQKELDLAYQKLKDTQGQLVQAEKMVSLGMLTAGITHEIKNPLNYISLASYALEEVFNSILSVNKKYEQIILDSNADSEEIKKIKDEFKYIYYLDKSFFYS